MNNSPIKAPKTAVTAPASPTPALPIALPLEARKSPRTGPIRGAGSRRKGASGEREFSAALHEHVGLRLTRNLEQSRQGGHDLSLPEGADGPVAEALARMAIEVKRYAVVTPGSLAAWWSQAVVQADRAGAWPALAYRGDRQEWRVRLPLAAVRPDFPYWDDANLAIDLHLVGFACLVREGAIAPRLGPPIMKFNGGNWNRINPVERNATL